MDWRDIPYSGGFLLTNQPVEAAAHFKLTPLPGGFQFWADASKATSFASVIPGEFVLVYGHWSDMSDGSTGNFALDLLESLRAGLSSFEDHLGRVAGRHVVLVRSEGKIFAYNDASGLRSLYYATDRPLVASHVNLLRQFGEYPAEYMPKSVAWALDYTRFAGIRQLLPNFRLNVLDRTVRRFYPREPNRFKDWTDAERLDRVETLWARMMRDYSQNFPKMAISISGGIDSRFILAMVASYGELLHGFTYGRVEAGEDRWSKVMNSDFKIASEILNYVDLKDHSFIALDRPPEVSRKLRQLLKKNTTGQHGFSLIPEYRKLFEGDGWLHLRGNGVGIIRHHMSSSKPTFDQFVKMFENEGSPDLRPRLEQMGYEAEPFGFNVLDLAYWEMRLGKWHSEIMNEDDAAFDTLLPVSTRELYELFLAFEPRKRRNGFAIHELINRNYPILNFFGVNGSRNLYEIRRDELRGKPSTEALEIVDAKLSGPDGQEVSMIDLLYSESLSIPMDYFQVGWKCIATLHETKTPGDLSFKLIQPYCRPTAIGYFEWQILVDGQWFLALDGAMTAEPVRISISGLQLGQRVSLALVPLTTSKKLSWQQASQTKVTEVKFQPTDEPTAEFNIAADNELVRAIRVSNSAEAL